MEMLAFDQHQFVRRIIMHKGQFSFEGGGGGVLIVFFSCCVYVCVKVNVFMELLTEYSTTNIRSPEPINVLLSKLLDGVQLPMKGWKTKASTGCGAIRITFSFFLFSDWKEINVNQCTVFSARRRL